MESVPEPNQNLVIPLLEEVCTKPWLTRCFGAAATFSLAGALTGIAISQNPADIIRFWTPALGQRLAREIDLLKSANPNDASGIVQFIGASGLFGWVMPRRIFHTVPLDRIRRLPSNELSHNPDINTVDSWQRQLWFGLRVLASHVPGRLMVDQSVVRLTLELWERNLAETSSEPDGKLHKINESMVR